MMVRYGVTLEEVDQVEGRGFVLEEHGSYPGRVVIVDADGAEHAAVGLASTESGVAAVEEVTLEITLDGFHPDGMRVRPASYGEIDARAVESAVVQGLEEGRGVQVIAVH